MRASAKGIEYPSSPARSNQPASEQASTANMICGGPDPRDLPRPGRFLTIENPNGCLCHQRLSLDTPIRR
jgi:hypothetical protein